MSHTILAPLPATPTRQQFNNANDIARRQILRVLGVSNAATLHRDALTEALTYAHANAEAAHLRETEDERRSTMYFFDGNDEHLNWHTFAETSMAGVA